jgi:diaminopimelate decarboxylase
MMSEMFSSALLGRASRVHLPTAGVGRSGTATVDPRPRADLYRKYFRMTNVAFPADALRLDSVVERVARQHWAVDACTSLGLGVVVAAGVSPARMTVHCDGLTATEIRCARAMNVGRLVVTSLEQAQTVASCGDASRPQHLLLRMAGREVDATVAAILAEPRLRLIGLDSRVDDSDGYDRVIDRLMGEVAWIRHRHGVLLDCLGLSTFEALDSRPAPVRAIAAAVDGAIEDGCARHRLPRPLLTFSPGWDLVDCVIG